MRAAFWALSALALLVSSCARENGTGDTGDRECSKQTDCADDQSRSCADGTCVDVGTATSMDIRLSKNADLANANIQSMRVVSIQTATPSGATAHCPTLGGKEVSSITAAKDVTSFNMIFEKGYPLASGDVYVTGAPMNDDTGVVYAEVFNVPLTQQNETDVRPVGWGCWDRTRDQFYECPAGSGHACITFELRKVKQ